MQSYFPFCLDMYIVSKKRDIGLIAYAILALYCMLTEFDSPTTHVIIFGAFAMALLWNSRSEEAEEGEENAEK